jgi:hypothetical protein
MADQILYVTLQDNALTPESNDFTGRVKLNGTWYNTTVARKVTEQRSELRYETILSILNMSDEVKRSGIASGYSVIDGVSHIRPSIIGRFEGQAAQYDPAIHSKGTSMSASPELRKALAASKVVVLGPALTGPVINRVEDVFSGTENGLLTPGRNLRIYGQRLRIAGEDAAVVGVWFVGADEAAARIRVDDRDLVDNNPSTLTVVVPALAAGGYFVEVVTQSGANSKTQVKEARTYRFEPVLTVE